MAARLARPAAMSFARPSLVAAAARPAFARARLHQAAVARAATGTIDLGESYIKGTVNDPTTFPAPSKSHGSYHWTFERLVSAATIPVVGATFVQSPNPVLDAVLAVTLVIHSHLGFDQVLLDYLHERKFPILGPVAKWSVRGLTLATLVGIYEFNTNDIGLTELVIRSWKA